MHSLIIQVSKDVNERPYGCHWFDDELACINPSVDYVAEVDTPIPEVLNLHIAPKPGLEIGGDNQTIVVTDKCAALEPYYNEWHDALIRALDAGFNEFCGTNAYKNELRISDATNNRYGLMFYCDYGMCSIQEFLRYSENGDVWHAVAAYDYHY